MGRPVRALVAFMVAWVLAGAGAAASALRRGTGVDEAAHLMRLVSPSGDELLVTGIGLRPGDRFLAPDNHFYEVTAVRGAVALTRHLGQRRLGADVNLLSPVPAAAAPRARPAAPTPGRRGPLAIYHTHSDESYLPTSGTTNEPWNGDIFDVGKAMSLVWRGARLDVLHSYRRHDPHDGLAYLRSRRTAMELLRRRPAALFDVHRDTPPAWVYRRVVDGQRLASVLLVLGRQNPTIWPNEAFAFSIKGYADATYPGLIRGILYAASDYNQDLHPRALLAEVGSTYNSLGEAMVGARFFSAVVPAILYGIRVDPQRMPVQPPQALRARESRSAWRGVAMVVVLVVAAGALYLLINEEAYEAVRRLGASLIGWVRRLLREPT